MTAMTAADLRARIAADQEALAKAEADRSADNSASSSYLDSVIVSNANNTGEEYVPPTPETRDSAIAEVRRRNGGKIRSEIEAERIGATAGETTVGLTGASSVSAADGRAEALRRRAARGR